MVKEPLVTIITPVRNEIKYLDDCINSVLNQSYSNIEQIFVDAVSTDGTLESLSRYKEKYPGRIRFISEPDNGVGEALNKGLRIAKGDIFGWLDTDGEYEPDAISTIVDFFKRNPKANVVLGGHNAIDQDGKIIGRLLPSPVIDLKGLINGTCCVPFVAFYRRGIIEKAGYFNPLGNGLDMWLRIVKITKVYPINKVLLNDKLRSTNVDFGKSPAQKKVRRRRWREDIVLCRKNGAGIFSTHVRRVSIFLVMDSLGLYTLIAPKVLRWARRSSIVNSVVRKFIGY